MGECEARPELGTVMEEPASLLISSECVWNVLGCEDSRGVWGVVCGREACAGGNALSGL